MHILIDKEGEQCRWRLVRRTDVGADLLARGTRTYPDEHACYHAVALLADAAGEAMLVLQQSDGHWKWLVNDPDGRPLVESPAVFRDAATCGQALNEIRRETRMLPAGTGASAAHRHLVQGQVTDGVGQVRLGVQLAIPDGLQVEQRADEQQRRAAGPGLR
jgi:hypothetical protein